MGYLSSGISKINNFFGDNILTISGEINITVSSIEVIDTFDKSLKKIEESLKMISDEYNFIKIDLRKGLADISIKFFAYKERISDKEFLDNFTNTLTTFLVGEWNSENYKVYVNIFGTYITCASKEVEFRFLNKKNDIRYIIVSEHHHSMTEYIKNSKWINICLSLVALFSIGYYLYSIYYESLKDLIN